MLETFTSWHSRYFTKRLIGTVQQADAVLGFRYFNRCRHTKPSIVAILEYVDLRTVHTPTQSGETGPVCHSTLMQICRNQTLLPTMNAKRDGASVEWRLRPDRNQRKIKALKRPYLLYTHEPPFGRFEKEFLQRKHIAAGNHYCCH